MSEVSNRFYVLSTGRAGSTFLSECLVSTGKFGHALHQQEFSRRLNIDSNKAFGNGSSQDSLLKDYLQNFDDAIPDSTCDPLQSMALYYFLKSTKPKAQIIHVVRDPRDMVRSFMNWKNRKLSGRIAHHFVPYWMPTPTQTGDLGAWEYLTMPKYAHYAWIWNFKNQLFSSLSDQPGYKRIRLEDLYASQAVMNDLFSFLGLDSEVLPERHSRKSNETRHKEFPKWQEWTPRMALNVNRYCGELMTELGYGNEPEWKALLAAK